MPAQPRLCVVKRPEGAKQMPRKGAQNWETFGRREGVELGCLGCLGCDWAGGQPAAGVGEDVTRALSRQALILREEVTNTKFPVWPQTWPKFCHLRLRSLFYCCVALSARIIACGFARSRCSHRQLCSPPSFTTTPRSAITT